MSWKGMTGWLMMVLVLIGCQQEEEVQPILNLSGAPFLEISDDSLLVNVADLSIEEKLGQLLIYQQDRAPDEATLQLIRMGLIGGLQFSGLRPSEYIYWKKELQSMSPLPLIVGLKGSGNYQSAFPDTEVLPNWSSWQAIGIDSLKLFALQMAYERLNRLDPDWAELPLADDYSHSPDYSRLSLASFCSERGILPLAFGGTPEQFALTDSSQQQLELIDFYKQLISAGMAGIRISINDASDAHAFAATTFIRQKLQYGGLLIADIHKESKLESALLMNPDLFIIEGEAQRALEQLVDLSAKGAIDEAWLDEKVSRVLKAKTWSAQNKPERKQPLQERARTLEASFLSAMEAPESIGSIDDYFYDESWAYWNRVVREASLVLAANPDEHLPFKQISTNAYKVIHHGTADHSSFDEYFGKYAAYESWTAKDWKSIQRFMEGDRKNTQIVLVLHEIQLDSAKAADINLWADQGQLSLINLKVPANLALLDNNASIIQAFDSDAVTQALLPQLLFGGIAAEGKLPYNYSTAFPQGHGFQTEKIRLNYGIAQQANISPQSLVGIDAIVNTAIEEKIFPGAQILAVKSGRVVYNKTFGYHTYAQDYPVKPSDLFDLASITKVAGTGLVAMKAYEEGKYRLNGKLKHYLEESGKGTLRNLTPKQLMSHSTGLQAHLPVVPYLLDRDIDNADCSTFFCKYPSDTFPIQVADSFYFARVFYDKVWKDMHRLKPRSTRFKYSDVNFVLLQRMLEEQQGQGLDTLLERDFYAALGLRRTLYNPLGTIARDQIVPTQKDELWRYQLLRGYVHDETAALMGGVAGHAGLFSNAEELAVIFEMLLNGGTYGGQKFLKPSTIETFTEKSSGNHRGLAFDKPKAEAIKEGAFPRQATTDLFGHTGFTGGCVWADPEQDLIYIFLSNRVYPDAGNKLLYKKRIRERVHQVIYDAIDTFSPGLPSLADA